MSKYAPEEARQAIQKAIWERCLRPADNEWTTYTDAIILAECAASALWEAGYEVRLIDGPKRPPELSPEERKKRADQRDRGVLNDGNGCGPPSESGGR